jgi:hypothetical protein
VSGNDRYRSLHPTDRLSVVLDLAEIGGSVDGAHHKQWALDQIVRVVKGPAYDAWRDDYCSGEDGPETYEWDEGIAP